MDKIDVIPFSAQSHILTRSHFTLQVHTTGVDVHVLYRREFNKELNKFHISLLCEIV